MWELCVSRAFEHVLKDRSDVRSFDMHSPHQGGGRIVSEEHKADNETHGHDPRPNLADD
jgi:hypothetical protein